MKSVSQMSKETNVNPAFIRVLIRGNNLPSAIHQPKDGKKYKVMYVDSETENKIHQMLFFSGKLEYLYLESKLNKKKL